MLAVITGKLCKINSFILSLIKYRSTEVPTSRMRQKSLFPNLYCFDVVGGLLVSIRVPLCKQTIYCLNRLCVITLSKKGHFSFNYNMAFLPF